MMRFFFNSISILFHPLLLTSYLLAILMYYFPVLIPIENLQRLYILGFILFTTGIIPAATVMVMYRQKMITSLAIFEREERTFPMVVTTFIYGVISYMLISKGSLFLFIGLLVLLITGTMTAVTLLSRFVKMSIHAVGLGGVLGILFRINFYYHSDIIIYLLLGTLIIAGLLGTARLYLQKHKPREVYYGYIVGFVICALIFPIII